MGLAIGAGTLQIIGQKRLILRLWFSPSWQCIYKIGKQSAVLALYENILGTGAGIWK